MPNPLAALFRRKKKAELKDAADFAEFFAAALAEAAPRGGAADAGGAAGDEKPAAVAVYRDSDRPFLVARVAEGEAAAAASLLEAACALLRDEGPRPFAARLPAEAGPAAEAGPLAWSSEFASAVEAFSARLGPAEAREAVEEAARAASADGQGAAPGNPAARPEGSLRIDEPLGLDGAELLFPSVFSVGSTRARMRPFALASGAGEAARPDGSAGIEEEVWFRFGWRAARTGGGPGAADGTAKVEAAGYWAFGKPAGVDGERFAAIAGALAKAAAAALEKGLKEAGLAEAARCAAAPSEPPRLGTGRVLGLEGRLSFGTTTLPFRAVVKEDLAAGLARGFGLGPDAERRPEAPAVADFLSLSAALEARRSAGAGSAENAAEAAVVRLAGGKAGAGPLDLPFCQLVESFGDRDLQLVARNFLPRATTPELLARSLFKAVGGPAAAGSGAGAGRAAAVRCGAFDVARLADALGPTFRDAFFACVRSGASAADEAERTSLDDALTDGLWKELRAGNLVLGFRAAALVAAARKLCVLPRRRAAFDALVARDEPFGPLRADPRFLRRVADACDARGLAAAVYGRPEDLGLALAWCSKGKAAAVEEELSLLAGRLEDGSLDPAEAALAKMEFARRAEALREADLKEEERRARSRIPDGGPDRGAGDGPGLRMVRKNRDRQPRKG